MMKPILIVGAGLSGAVIARALAEAGYAVAVVDERGHVAGNCHTARDARSGVMLHTYGPHIFHTDDEEVWRYVNTHARFRPYVHRVRITAGGRVFALPINLHTINQFFGRAFRPDEARAFIASLSSAPSDREPRTFEEQALKAVGRDLYEAFLRGYTMKQWGREPAELPASVLKRLPLRFNYDDSYFSHRFQGMPEDGYTAMVDNILRHGRIALRLRAPFARGEAASFGHVFYSGPIDRYFDHAWGRLEYRTLDFETFHHDGDYQGCAVMNYGDVGTAQTRITEYRHFTAWEQHDVSVCHREFPRACGQGDIPYYPVRLAEDTVLLNRYVVRARAEPGVTFVGRLGTYRYLDMDVTIREALDAARLFIDHAAHGRAMPAFCVEP